MSASLIDPHYLVLVALSGEMGHGLQIQRRIIADTTGVYVKQSTLYLAIRLLQRDGMIEIAYPEGRSNVYRLTSKGKRQLELAARTLADTARHVERRLA